MTEKIGCVQHDCDECVARLAQPEQEPVAYLVTGPYEKQVFSSIDSANSYCNGLNKGFGEVAYSVSPLYTAPPQRPWVGLTKVDILAASQHWRNSDDFAAGVDWAEATLKAMNI